jgi:hypothetical protein
VTWTQDDTQYETANDPERRGWKGTIIGAIVLAVIGSGSAFGWRAYGGSPLTFTLGSSAIPEQKTVGFDEFNAFKQQVAGQMQPNAQALAAQLVELKRLSDQTAAMSAKIDALESSVLAARTAIPTVAPNRAQKASKPKSAPPPISTGAARLPPPVQLTH